ncbi:hypothetical protein BU25DRAFT_423805 [Macroventuria anomochaeta]|uniref:Uncharacterized protein n=1 Tax=Macroventuria anomochaeta TaxID=301207 RepID=A0ACB6RUE1_9PLEO|nr:uncharacterized protein BU25DRAFT_423805 [Macroventuria anomochaeta]KAF2624683.1 hypothetical protein BU25DRAFT_423805 [Macroventuria anomochaeta]
MCLQSPILNVTMSSSLQSRTSDPDCLLQGYWTTYSKNDPTTAAKSLEFEEEARMLWCADCGDPVPNLAGLTLLFTSRACHGHANQDSTSYLIEACEMAKRIKLFGVQDTITAFQPQSLTDEAPYAVQQATWGAFNLYK